MSPKTFTNFFNSEDVYHILPAALIECIHGKETPVFIQVWSQNYVVQKTSRALKTTN